MKRDTKVKVLGWVVGLTTGGLFYYLYLTEPKALVLVIGVWFGRMLVDMVDLQVKMRTLIN